MKGSFADSFFLQRREGALQGATPEQAFFVKLDLPIKVNGPALTASGSEVAIESVKIAQNGR